MNLETAILIIVVLTMIIAIIGAVLFLVFTRKGKNLVTKIVYTKRYVICHLSNPNTEFVDDWYVVPRPDFYTKVGKYLYNLNPDYATRKEKGRLHFDLDVNDAIPIYPKRTNSDEEIIQQVIEVQTAIDNNVKDFLYRKQQNIALIIAFVALAIAILIALYAVYTIQTNNAILDQLKEQLLSDTRTVIQGK